MPIFYAIGGPNGSEKTTFMKSFFDNNIPVIRPDDLMIADPFSLQEAIQYYLQDLANTQQDFAFEHNFHTNSSYKYFDWATKQGYGTKLIYLAISDVEICLSRVNERFISGRGHYVDEATIHQRYKDSLFNLKTNLKRVDEIIVIDNTNIKSPTPSLIFKKGLLEISNNAPLWLIDAFKYQLKF
jgi:predicted ABC-type ATPase